MRGRHTPRDRHPSLSVCARVAGTTRRQSAGARRRVAHSHRARLLIIFVWCRADFRERPAIGSHNLRAALAAVAHSMHSSARASASVRVGRHTLEKCSMNNYRCHLSAWFIKRITVYTRTLMSDAYIRVFCFFEQRNTRIYRILIFFINLYSS